MAVTAAALPMWTAPAATGSWRALVGAARSPESAVSELVLLVSAAGITGASLWLLACMAALHRGPRRRTPDGALRPRLLRLLVATALASTTTTAVGAAGADHPPVRHVLDGLPLPDRAYGGVRTHRVTLGESLWTVAADTVAPDAPAPALASVWLRLHALNRDRIGPDPDLLRVGTRVRLPPSRPGHPDRPRTPPHDVTTDKRGALR